MDVLNIKMGNDNDNNNESFIWTNIMQYITLKKDNLAKINSS